MKLLVVDLLYGLAMALLGAAAPSWFWWSHFRRKAITPSGAEAHHAGEVLARLQELATRVAFDVDEHDCAQDDFTSAAARKHSLGGESAAQLGHVADAIQRARPDSAHATKAHDPIGNATAAPCVRNTFSLALGHRLAESARRGDPLSVILVHIDNYQALCDRYGLPAGNQILDAAGKFFIASVRGMDWVASLDVTTFALLLPNTSHANALHVAERLRTTVSSASLFVDGALIPLTISLGTTEATLGDSSEAILRRAEEAMHTSIRTGGNRIHSHADGRLETACRRLKSFLLRLEAVPQDADPLDLDLGYVAGLQVDGRLPPHADAAGRAAENQVARVQGAKLRDVATS